MGAHHPPGAARGAALRGRPPGVGVSGGATTHHHDHGSAHHDHDARPDDHDAQPHDHDHRGRADHRTDDQHLAPTTSVPTVAAPTTSTSASPPETVLDAPPTVPALPRTGVDVVAVAMLGAGLLLLGAAALELRRQRTTAG